MRVLLNIRYYDVNDVNFSNRYVRGFHVSTFYKMTMLCTLELKKNAFSKMVVREDISADMFQADC